MGIFESAKINIIYKIFVLLQSELRTFYEQQSFSSFGNEVLTDLIPVDSGFAFLESDRLCLLGVFAIVARITVVSDCLLKKSSLNAFRPS